MQENSISKLSFAKSICKGDRDYIYLSITIMDNNTRDYAEQASEAIVMAGFRDVCQNNRISKVPTQ